jgi:phosphoesterase RecJ-like protein
MATMATSNSALNSQLDPSLVQQALALIEPAHHIAILAHEHPDGDCLGSALGLTHILELLGKTCVPVCADPAPEVFSIIPGIERLQQTLGEPGNEPFDLVIAVDAGELSRYGTLHEHHQAFLQQVPILNIDHHVSSSGCGRVNIIDPTAAATGELLVLFQQQARLPLTSDAAQCLLTGIITDTSSFQFTSTTPRTMEAGAELLRAGAIAEPIVKAIFRSRPWPQVRFRAAVINQAQVACAGRLIWSYATNETLAAVGASPEMDDNMSGTLRDVDGVQIAAFFKTYENPAETRLSLRTAEPYHAANICMRYGGGGHARAAGATINLPLKEAIALVVADLQYEIEQQDQQQQ